jgi:type IV pilus assembly protein PilA
MNLKGLRKNKKGFTLIEIIVVIVILAVLMAVAVPSVLKYVDEANNAKYMSQARGALIVAEAEVAKAYIADPDKVGSEKSNMLTISETVEGTPEVKTIVASVDDKGQISNVYVTFGEVNSVTKYAIITPNGTVKITTDDPKIKANGTIENSILK